MNPRKRLGVLVTALCVAGALVPEARAAAGGGGVSAGALKSAWDVGAKYLVAHQNEDGSYGSRAKPGVTALVIRALATGPRAYRLRDGAFMSRAVDYLLAGQREDGSFCEDNGTVKTYQTAMAVSALRALDGEKYDDAVTRGVAFLKSAQVGRGITSGGFSYGENGRGDLSNTWVALDALKDAGVPPDDPIWAKALAFTKRCQHNSETNKLPWAGNDGSAVYFPVEEAPADGGGRGRGEGTLAGNGSMTYAMLISYVHCQLHPEDSAFKAGLNWIRENYTVTENPGQGETGKFYYYEVMSRLLHLLSPETLGDGEIADWPTDLGGKLLTLRRDDGSWVGAADRHQEGDPVLVTAYAMEALARCMEAMDK